MSANRLFGALLALLLAGCALPNPEKAPVKVQPSNAPIRNLTSFSESLRCMDRLFVAFNKTGFDITSTDIPDATGKLNAGVRDMLITAVSRMSTNSHAFLYLDFQGTAQDTVGFLSQKMLNAGQMNVRAPQVYITGSISQADQAVEVGKEGVGLTTGMVDFGANRDRNVSLITLDLHLGEFSTRRLLPGIDATNSIAVVRSGQGLDAGAMINKAGISFNFSADHSEGSGQALRTLIELGAIELLGRWTQVPYWTCLQIDRSNPVALNQMRDWWDSMSEPDRRKFIHEGLRGTGYLQVPAGAVSDDLFRLAITRFQTDRGIIPNGRIGFDVYEQLMNGQITLPVASSTAPKMPQVRGEPLKLTLTSTEPNRIYNVGDRLYLKLSLSRTAYPICYYADASGIIVQIFPNRFQPNRLQPGNQPLLLPDTRITDNIALELAKAGRREEVACVASEADIEASLPPSLRVEALTPIRLRNLDELIAALRSVTPAADQFAVGRVAVTPR